MADTSRQLVAIIAHGTDHELSSVGFTVANGGMTAGMRVTIFLVSSGVDPVRKRAVEKTVVAPLDPLKSLIEDFRRRGGRLIACPPCVGARGYEQEDLIDGWKSPGRARSTNC
jgi:predicted peroxiredoxin